MPNLHLFLKTDFSSGYHVVITLLDLAGVLISRATIIRWFMIDWFTASEWKFCCVSIDTFAAVDIWSVGVIFLSLLAGHYPIFKASDDMEALSQIVCVFGSEELKTAAKLYGNAKLSSRCCCCWLSGADYRIIVETIEMAHWLCIVYGCRPKSVSAGLVCGLDWCWLCLWRTARWGGIYNHITPAT